MLIDPSGTEILTLNPVGTLVWEALDGRSEASQLAVRLLPQLSEVTREELEQDVAEFLAELEAAGLTEEAAPPI